MSDNGDDKKEEAIRALFAQLTGHLEDMAADAVEGQALRLPIEWHQIANRLIDRLDEATDVAATIVSLTS